MDYSLGLPVKTSSMFQKKKCQAIETDVDKLVAPAQPDRYSIKWPKADHKQMVVTSRTRIHDDCFYMFFTSKYDYGNNWN